MFGTSEFEKGQFDRCRLDRGDKFDSEILTKISMKNIVVRGGSLVAIRR